MKIMSATVELLLEQIEQQEHAIKAAAESGHDTKTMREELKQLHQKLANANKALNEGKQLLKS